ncbi:MAG: arylsulfatase [Verrucomicrobiales bacterium]|nr:arylsulfatase [Verrucomicrobiales bacterium]
MKCLALACTLTALAVTLCAAPPNVVIILADDMGWGDPHCYQAESKIPTPQLDRLAAHGMRFTDAHTPSSVCTPTRYTLLTGRYCWRTRLESGVLDGFSPPLIENDRPTLATLLGSAGYQTACIGKWHLGMQWTRRDGSPETADRDDRFRSGETIDFSQPLTAGPLTNGFQSYFGISASLDMPPYCWIENDRCTPAPDTTVETAQDTIFLNQTGGAAHSAFHLDAVLPTLKQRAIRWITEAARSDRPFFLYLPLNSPHLPVAPSAAFRGQSGLGDYADFVMETDDCVGGVLDALEAAGVEENTLVLFTSDNGGLWHAWEPQEIDDQRHYKPTPRGQYNLEHGHRSNAHLRGTKADIWEGGHRVPFLVQWPARVQGGSVSTALIELTDVMATLADATGIPLPQGAAEDSFSFLPALEQRTDLPPTQRPFAIHHSLRGLFSLRQADWKYVEERGSGGFSTPRSLNPSEGQPQGQLYHLSVDPQETQNLWAEAPDRVQAMQHLLDRARRTGLTKTP